MSSVRKRRIEKCSLRVPHRTALEGVLHRFGSAGGDETRKLTRTKKGEEEHILPLQKLRLPHVCRYGTQTQDPFRLHTPCSSICFLWCSRAMVSTAQWSGVALMQVLDPAELCRNVASTQEWRNAATKACIEMESYVQVRSPMTQHCRGRFPRSSLSPRSLSHTCSICISLLLATVSSRPSTQTKSFSGLSLVPSKRVTTLEEVSGNRQSRKQWRGLCTGTSSLVVSNSQTHNGNEWCS